MSEPSQTNPQAVASSEPISGRVGRPRVVVVGAGFGGIAVAHALRSSPVETIVVDQRNFHVFSPLLYQVATALLEEAEVAQSVRGLLRGAPNASFRMARVEGLDFEAKRVLTDRGEIGYDYLALAAGSVNDYYGNLAIAQRSLALNDLGEALALRNQILARCEQATWTTDPEERRRLLSFVVVGGGPTGVEFVGSLSELVYGILGSDFPDLAVEEISLTLVEASELPLPPFAPSLQRATAQALAKRRVEIVRGLVTDVDDQCVRLKDGQTIQAATVVWAAGVRAEPLAERLGVELGSQHRVKVGPTLQLPGHDHVFVLGDLAEIPDGERPLPMLATVAMESGRHAGRSIARMVSGKAPQPFRYRNLGTMATVGRRSAVAQIGPLKLSGSIGWLAWLFVHIMRVVGVRARASVLLNWAFAYLIRDRPVCLIVEPRAPRVPGHESDKDSPLRRRETV